MIKNKKLLESIIVFMFFSGITMLINLNSLEIEYDKLWLIHMMQKVANGDLMYSEINILVGPIFYALGGIVFKIFGTSFYTFDIFSGILYGIFALLTYKICKEINYDNDWKINLLFFSVLFYFSKVLYIGAYNVISLFFILFAMLIELRKNKIENKRKSNLFIGILLGLAFFTKQTIAGMAIIATGMITLIDYLVIEKKNPMKEILEKSLGFFIIFIPMILIMHIKGNLLDYIDLCFGGIFEFGSKNVSIVTPSLYLALMIGILIASVMLIKFNFEDKDFLVISFYAIATLFYGVPLFNSYHAHLSTFTIWFLLIKLIKIMQKHDKMHFVKLLESIPLVLLFVSIYTISGNALNNISSEVFLSVIWFYMIGFMIDILVSVLLGVAIICDNKKMIKTALICFSIFTFSAFSYNFYLKAIDKGVPLGLEIYAGHGFEKEEVLRIEEVISYIKLKENEGYDVIVITSDASKYMIPLNRNNNKYDLLLNGNLGYRGSNAILDEIKSWKNTLILQNKEVFWQEPENIRSYVENNCSKIEEIGGLEVYLKD